MCCHYGLWLDVAKHNPCRRSLALQAGLPQLTCLSLRQCFALPAAALHSLRQVSTLQALDLHGLLQARSSSLRACCTELGRVHNRQLVWKTRLVFEQLHNLCLGYHNYKRDPLSALALCSKFVLSCHEAPHTIRR